MKARAVERAGQQLQGFRRGEEETGARLDARDERGDREETDDRLVFNITGCLWARTWLELGAPDIGYLWNCKLDFALVQAMHPSLRLRGQRP